MKPGGTILYICNRRRCANCNEECMHTTDPDYAINPAFDKSRFIEREGDWWEVADESKGLHQDSRQIRE